MPSFGLSAQGIVGAGVRRFFARNRVTISLLLFVSLIVKDLIFQTKPQHGWLRDTSWQGNIGLSLVLLGVGLRSWAAGILRKGRKVKILGRRGTAE